jgi:hypothetical protein
MIVPGNLDIEELAAIFAKEIMAKKIVVETCYLRVEKLFFASQMKYLAVYFGAKVNTDVTINEELSFIYNLLNNGNKKPFPHKKLLKKLREMYGMVKLLNIAL